MRRVCSAARTVQDLPLVQAPNVLDALIELESVSGSAHLDYVQRPGCRALSVVGTGGILDVDVPAGTVTRRDLAGTLHVYRFSQERDELFRLQLANLAAWRAEPVCRWSRRQMASGRWRSPGP